MRDNGYLLSRYPVPANLSLAQIYGQPRTGALITQLRQQDFPERGFVQGPSSLDGPDFLNAFHRLPHYPVTLFVALPMSEIREAWWRRVSGTYLALLILLFAELAAYTYAARRQHAWTEISPPRREAIGMITERRQIADFVFCQNVYCRN